jgi:A/G-specific adenine glycosylase
VNDAPLLEDKVSKFHAMLKKSGICEETLNLFKKIVWDHYKRYGRKFSFRNTQEPYHILISEVMLQQTQAERVEKKFDKFIEEIPDFKSLAAAPVEKILKL